MATFTVSSGQTSSGITLHSGDIENILNGGTAAATAISSGGSAHVSSGGIASGSVVFKGGFEYVLHGGTATATAISSGGEQDVSSGGAASGAMISRGGSEFIFSGGVASNVTVSSGGTQFVDSGKASGTIVQSGGTLTVQAGGVAFSATVNAGATETVNGITSNTHLTSGAVEDVLLLAVGTVVDSGATELVDNFIGNHGTVNDTLLEVGGTIDVSFLTYTSGGTVSLNSSTDLLTVSQGGHTYSQHLSGSYTGHTFELVSDGGSGTSIIAVACFRRGTRIAKPDVEIAVEALAIGDRVLTRDGPQPIIRIEHRAIDCRHHADPRLVWPVRIRAGAFGRGMPRRDLYLSPDHAVFLDGVLIPAKYLIDTDAIVQVPVVQVDYWHVELERHAVLLAEGLPVESYLDATRHLAWEAEAYAPLVVGGPQLAAARAALAA